MAVEEPQPNSEVTTMKFLLSAHLPENYEPSEDDANAGPAIHAFNAELEAAGALFFACGLMPAAHAKTVAAQPDGQVLITDGPYLETKEYIGGFLIIDVADMDEALAWAKKGAAAARRPFEVRQIFFNGG